MSAFFSSTDIKTLRVEGNDRNNFVSLIVNNEGSYRAAITRKITKRTVQETITYNMFGEGEKTSQNNYENYNETIEYYYLNIVKENDNEFFGDIDWDKLVNQITNGYIKLLTQTYDRFAQLKLSKEAYLEYPLETEFLGSIYDTETIFDQINDYYIKEPNSDWEAHQINDGDKPFYIRKPDLPSGREITLEVSDDDDGYYIGIASEIISGSKLTIFSVPLKSKNWKAVANQIDDFAKTLLK